MPPEARRAMADRLRHAGPSLWQAPDPCSLAWREWGDEHVVFDAATAATHLLSASGGAVLRCLLEGAGPQTEAELQDRLAAQGDGAAPGGAALTAQGLAELLRELEQIGLARRAAP